MEERAQNQKKIGELIAARRRARGWTQKDLAAQLLVSDKAVSKWETGGSYPDVALLHPLASALGLTVDELLAGEEASPAAGGADAAAGDSRPGEPAPAAADPDGGRWLLQNAGQRFQLLALAALLLVDVGIGLVCANTLNWGMPAAMGLLLAGFTLVLGATLRYRQRAALLAADAGPMPGYAAVWLLQQAALLAFCLWCNRAGWWVKMLETGDLLMEDGTGLYLSIDREGQDMELLLNQMSQRIVGLSYDWNSMLLLTVLLAAGLALFLWGMARGVTLRRALPGPLLAAASAAWLLTLSWRLPGKIDLTPVVPRKLPAGPLPEYTRLVLAGGAVYTVVLLAAFLRRNGRHPTAGALLLYWLPAGEELARISDCVAPMYNTYETYAWWEGCYFAHPLLLTVLAALLFWHFCLAAAQQK